MENKDYFEHHEELTGDIRTLTDEMNVTSIEGFSYVDCGRYLARAEKLGWTFEYGLDSEPFGLTKIN